MCISSLALLGVVTGSNEEGRLVKSLLEAYTRVGGRWARGVANPKDRLNVTHGLTINNVHLHPTLGVMAVTAWENMVNALLYTTVVEHADH